MPWAPHSTTWCQRPVFDRNSKSVSDQNTPIGAEGNLTVRFGDFGNDEVGELAASFDSMTAELQSTLRELRSTTDYLWGIVENSADIIITGSDPLADITSLADNDQVWMVMQDGVRVIRTRFGVDDGLSLRLPRVARTRGLLMGPLRGRV